MIAFYDGRFVPSLLGHIWGSVPQNLQQDLCDQQRLRSACTFTQYGKVLVYPSLDRPEAVEGTCDQQILWSDCVDAGWSEYLLVAQILL